MDTASATTMKALNFLPTSTTQRATNFTSQTLPTKPNSHSLHLQTSNPRRSRAISLIRCSTKPDTNTDNQKDQNSTVDPNLNPKPLNPSPPTSVDPPSTPISSFPSSKGLVFDLGVEGSWDGAGVGSPVVKRFLGDQEERWYMWYHGRSDLTPGSDSIGLAVSSNGVHWNRGRGAVQSSQDVGLVMSSGKDWWAFDTLSIRPSEVVVMSSSKIRGSSAVYWLYYTGYSPEKAEINEVCTGLENPERSGEVFKSLPGLAMSQDGRHWARIEGEHHSGALFDVGLEKDWDSTFIGGCHVVFHERGDLRMYYHSFDVKSGDYGVGIGRSRDGMKWIKMGKIIGGGRKGGFDEMGAMNPSVVRKRGSGEYLMAYEGVDGNGGRSIGLALSSFKRWAEGVGKVWRCRGVEVIRRIRVG